MWLKILRKDFAVYGKFILIGYLAQLLFSVIMVTYADDDSWRPFIFIGCIQISIVVLFYLVFEKMTKYDLLFFSLPLTKKQIVFSKYSTSIIITVVGLFLWYAAASILYSTLNSVPQDFYKFDSMKTVIVIAVFFSFFISLFAPLAIKIKHYYYLIIPMIIIAYLYVKGIEQSGIFDSSHYSTMALLIASVLIIIPIVVSFYISVQLINKQDTA